MLPWPHPDHLAFRRVEAILSEYEGQNHPIARHRLPFSFNVEDQYSQMQTTPPRKTQGGRQLGQTEKRNDQPQIDDPPRGDPGTERVHQAIPAIDLPGSLQGDQHGERKPSIPSHLPPPQLLQKASANPTPPNAPSHRAAAPPPRPNTGIKTNTEVYPLGRGSSGQAASGEQFSAPRPDQANDSRHGQSGFKSGPRSSAALESVASRGRSNQVPPGPKEAEIRLHSPPNPRSDTATRATDLDETEESRRARLGSNTGAPVTKAPNDVSVVPPIMGQMGGSRARSNQVPPGPKEAENRLDSRIPFNSPSDTTTRTTDHDEAKEPRHARSGSNTGAPISKAPNSVSDVPTTLSDMGGSKGWSSQVPPSLITASLGPETLSGSHPLRAPGVGIASPPTPQPQDSAATLWMNQEMNPSIPTYASVNPQQQNDNPHVPLDDHSPLSSQCRTHATGSSLITVPTFGAHGMGGT